MKDRNNSISKSLIKYVTDYLTPGGSLYSGQLVSICSKGGSIPSVRQVRSGFGRLVI